MQKAEEEEERKTATVAPQVRTARLELLASVQQILRHGTLLRLDCIRLD